MSTSVARLLLLVPLAAACGSRTGLPVPGLDANCPQRDDPWLVLDARGLQGGGTASLYAMRADGTGGHAVHLPHAPAYFPSVSPSGTKLLYATTYGDGGAAGGGPDSALYAYDLASRTEQLVVTTTGLTYSALSPDGQNVAYVSDYTLRAVGFDGTNDHALLAGPNGDGAGYGHPTFAADSRTVVYATGGAFGAIGLDGTGGRTLVSTSATLLYPNVAFSPDYTQIAAGVLCDQASAMALVVYDYASLPAPCSRGQVLTQVTESSAFNGANDPAWGPTGLLAYGSGSDVWVIPASGGTPVNVTQGLTGDGGTVTAAEPVWAPGCARIP